MKHKYAIINRRSKETPRIHYTYTYKGALSIKRTMERHDSINGTSGSWVIAEIIPDYEVNSRIMRALRGWHDRIVSTEEDGT